MAKYVIERDLPGAGRLTPAQLRDISRKSCGVLQEMGSGIQWMQSYVTADKLYCIYIAENEAQVRRHAEKGGFPCGGVARVSAVIDPATAD
jgi:hypothetical protein